MRTGSVVIRRKAEQVAEAGLRIEYLAKAGANKETLVTDSTPEGWGLPDQGLCFVRVPTHRRPGPCPKISRRTAQRKAARYPGSTGAHVLPGGPISEDEPKLLHRVCGKMHQGERNYRGLNFFSPEDAALPETLARGEFNLRGFRNQTLRQHLSHPAGRSLGL